MISILSDVYLGQPRSGKPPRPRFITRTVSFAALSLGEYVGSSRIRTQRLTRVAGFGLRGVPDVRLTATKHAGAMRLGLPVLLRALRCAHQWSWQ